MIDPYLVIAEGTVIVAAGWAVIWWDSRPRPRSRTHTAARRRA